jgi:predicted ester cyclase
MFYSAYPDLHTTIEDMIAEGDKVVTRLTFGGTHQGTFQGIPPTGKQVTITGIQILRIADSKLVEHRSEFDALGMMQQLGVISAMG